MKKCIGSDGRKSITFSNNKISTQRQPPLYPFPGKEEIKGIGIIQLAERIQSINSLSPPFKIGSGDIPSFHASGHQIWHGDNIKVFI
jgi:hypothetical protein